MLTIVCMTHLALRIGEEKNPAPEFGHPILLGSHRFLLSIFILKKDWGVGGDSRNWNGGLFEGKQRGGAVIW